MGRDVRGLVAVGVVLRNGAVVTDRPDGRF